MNILIVTIGSRGDVQPVVALGKKLSQFGHNVTIATHLNFKIFVEENNLLFHNIGVNPKEILNSKKGENWTKSTNNPIKFFKALGYILNDTANEIIDNLEKICNDTELIISCVMGLFVTPFLARHYNKKHISLFLQPFSKSTYYTGIYFPEVDIKINFLRKLYNSITHDMTWFFIRSLLKRINKKVIAQKFGYKYPNNSVSNFIKSDDLILYGFSQYFFKKPVDWNEKIKIPGYFFLEENKSEKLDSELTNFIENGNAPLYVGFGSMVAENISSIAGIIIKAILDLNYKAVICKGWGDIGGYSENKNLFFVNSLPHSILFPKMNGVIHHGGAGTTSTALICGCPQMILPFFDDQPFWGNLVYKNNLGPKPLNYRKLNYHKVKSRIYDLVENQNYKLNSQRLQKQIINEDGPYKAANIIDDYLKQ